MRAVADVREALGDPVPDLELNEVLINPGNERQSFFLGQSIRWDEETAGITFCLPGVFGL